MDNEEAINYLKRKGQLESKKYTKEEIKTEKQLVKEDEEEIQQVMKRGKIYGDPMVYLEGGI